MLLFPPATGTLVLQNSEYEGLIHMQPPQPYVHDGSMHNEWDSCCIQ